MAQMHERPKTEQLRLKLDRLAKLWNDDPDDENVAASIETTKEKYAQAMRDEVCLLSPSEVDPDDQDKEPAIEPALKGAASKKKEGRRGACPFGDWVSKERCIAGVSFL